MENRHRISSALPREEWEGFVRAGDLCRPRTPSEIAWTLETVALGEGWPAGSLFGSERQLLQRFGVSRAVLRQAIRLVQSRGSMHMERGRNGGLRLLQPDIAQAVNAMTTYLGAIGCTREAVLETMEVAAEVLAELPRNDLLVRIYESTVASLTAGPTSNVAPSARALMIASHLIERARPIPQEGIDLGSEAELCERLSTCRDVLRQALCILDDIGMLQVRRGRGGGYRLQPPARLGIVRHVFAILASRRLALPHTMRAVWSLDIMSLRLAARRLAEMSLSARTQTCNELNAVLEESSEPIRWVLLQRALGEVAGNAIVNTLRSCFVAYQARLGRPPTRRDRDDELHGLEQAIVMALRRGAVAEAERWQRAAQAILAELLLGPEPSRANCCRSPTL